HHMNDIFVGQGAFTSFNLTTQSTIELHPAHSGQIITLLAEEQILEKRLGRFFGWRLTRTHHPVNLYQGFELGASRVNAQGFRNEWTTIQFVGVERFNFLYAGSSEFSEDVSCNFGITFKQYFTGSGVDDIFRQ